MDDIKSLQAKVHATTLGSEKLPLLLELSDKLVQTHMENSITYAKEAEELAIKLGDENSLANAYRLQAQQVYYSTDHTAAFALLDKAKMLYSKTNDRAGVAHTLNNEGWVFLGISDFDTATKVFTSALEIFRQENSPKYVARSLNNLSIPAKTRGDYELSLTYLNEAIGIYETLNEPMALTNAKANKAVVYFHLHMFRESLDIFVECLQFYEKEFNRHYYANTLISIANCGEQLGDYVTSLKYLHMGLKAFSALGHNNSMARIYIDMGNTLVKMGGNQEAFINFTKALNLLENDNDYGEIYGFTNFCLGRHWLEVKDYEKAIVYLTKSLKVGEEKSITHLITISQTKLAELYTATGDLDKAKTHSQYIGGNQMVA